MRPLHRVSACKQTYKILANHQGASFRTTPSASVLQNLSAICYRVEARQSRGRPGIITPPDCRLIRATDSLTVSRSWAQCGWSAPTAEVGYSLLDARGARISPSEAASSTDWSEAFVQGWRLICNLLLVVVQSESKVTVVVRVNLHELCVDLLHGAGQSKHFAVRKCLCFDLEWDHIVAGDWSFNTDSLSCQWSCSQKVRERILHWPKGWSRIPRRRTSWLVHEYVVK